MRIFIDTNKYLDFYRASDHSLVILEKLIELINLKKIEVILPKQVIDEFERDKDIIFKNFTEENFKEIKTPGFLSGKNQKIKNVNKGINSIKVDYEKKFYNKKSKINILLKKIFDLSIRPDEEKEILTLAHYRTLRGNPPRKGNQSFGDAIIWETLLDKFSDKDLVIISGDNDFSSDDGNKSKIHPFLKKEWFSKNKRTVDLMNNLGQFINQMTKNDTITKDVIEEEIFVGYQNRNLVINDGVLSVLDHSFLKQENTLSGMIGNNNFEFNQKCVCCGDFIKNQIVYSTSTRCNKCSDIFSTPKNCTKCGRHFHESYFSPFSSTSYNLSTSNQLLSSENISLQNFCPDCKK